jgi:hypothetical protein
MNRCTEQEEATTTLSDAGPKGAGYECRKEFLWFTLEKRDYHDGELISQNGERWHTTEGRNRIEGSLS